MSNFYNFRYKRFLLLLTFIAVELGIAYQLIYIVHEKLINSVDIFTLNKKYYLYNIPKSQYKYFYELRNNLGSISDLTSIPRWLKNIPVYHINKDGLNAYTNFSIKKIPGTYRILALGDSFTFGLFLSTKYAWPEVLQYDLNNDLDCKNIKKFEVINLGIGGYDLTYDTERFRLKGAKYKPDLVIWLLRDGNYVWVNELVQPILNSYNIDSFAKSKSNSSQGLSLLNEVEGKYSSKYGSLYPINYSKNSLIDFGNSYKGKLLILNLPQYSSNPLIKQITMNFVQNRPNTYLDSNLPDILSNGGTFPETHPNRYGDAVIARSIETYLMRNIITCNK